MNNKLTQTALAVAKATPPSDGPSRPLVTFKMDNDTRASFADGAVPVSAEDLHHSKSALQIESIRTLLVFDWPQPNRTWKLRYFSEAQATIAMVQINIHGRLSNRGLENAFLTREHDYFVINIAPVDRNFLLVNIVRHIPLEYRPTSQDILQGEASHGWDFARVDAIADELSSLIGVRPQEIDIEDNRDTASRRVVAKFAVGLDEKAGDIKGKRLACFAGSQFELVEQVCVKLHLDADIGKSLLGFLAIQVQSCRSKHQVRVDIDDTTCQETGWIEFNMQGPDRASLIAAKAELDKFILMRPGESPHRPLPRPQTHRIDLSDTANFVNAFQKGGLERVKAQYPTGTVYLDEYTEPPDLVVKGDEDRLREVQQCLDGVLPESKARVCAICWDDNAEEFVKLEGCGHVACSACFTQWCTVDRESKFPLYCFSTDCSNRVTMKDLHVHLSGSDFERTLSQSISEHFRSRPEEYVPCTDRDCNAILPREPGSDSKRSCARCFTVMCLDCKAEYHFEETCEQYLAGMADGRKELDEWIHTEGAKRCPNCQCVVQKMQGCDNLKCMNCKVDFCFACLKMFNSHEDVYRHQIRDHGSYYGDPQEEEAEMRRLMELEQE